VGRRDVSGQVGKTGLASEKPLSMGRLAWPPGNSQESNPNRDTPVRETSCPVSSHLVQEVVSPSPVWITRLALITG
jgi:hypothetical protein